MLTAVALSAFALPASAALYAEVGVTPPAASVEIVPDQTYTQTFTYTYEPGYVERRSYTVETQPGFVEQRSYIIEIPQSEPEVLIRRY